MVDVAAGYGVGHPSSYTPATSPPPPYPAAPYPMPYPTESYPPPASYPPHPATAAYPPSFSPVPPYPYQSAGKCLLLILL